jgi:hypothetical protein
MRLAECILSSIVILILRLRELRWCESLILALDGLHVKHGAQRAIWLPTPHLLCYEADPWKLEIELTAGRTVGMQTDF